jgi:rhodanese/phosphatase family protein
MNSPLPFRYCYWAVPAKILAGCCPGSVDGYMLPEQLDVLIDAGVTLVVNLMEESETELMGSFMETYEPILAAVAQARGSKIRMERFPIADRSIPTVEEMKLILRRIQKELDAGGAVYVHCLGGIGRTGTVIGCYFAGQGEADPLGKLWQLTEPERDYFRPTPQTTQQRNFVLKWKEVS